MECTNTKSYLSSYLVISSSTKKTVERLKTVTIDADEVVISFDIALLYTNVSVKEAIQEASERLCRGDVKAPRVDEETFIILATIWCTNVLM